MLVELTQNQLRYLHFLVDNQITEEPEYINQEQAYRRFKRCNVDRWARNQIINRYLRPRNVEYSLAELRNAAANQNDYLYE